MTREEFIKRAREVHGENTYNYERVVYLSLKDKVEIICSRHGSFLQSPNKHLYRKQGCAKCGIEKNTKNRSLTREEFIRRAREVHGDRYDYSKVEYVNSQSRVEIICREHGSFYQIPNNHIDKKNGCLKCGREVTSSKLSSEYTTFVEEALHTHGNRYSYEKINSDNYSNLSAKVEIICHEHGSFWQSPANHRKGVGCPKCGEEKAKKSRLLTLDQFIEKAKKVHGEKYSYAESEYLTSHLPIKITCPSHGPFWQTANDHIIGHGCQKCGRDRTREGRTLGTAEFITRSKDIHKERYSYSEVQYTRNSIPVEIICGKHGIFSQTPASHMKGSGCPKCSSNTSRGEKEVLDYVTSLGFSAKKQRIEKFEIDIYIQEANLAIEYNGLYWHREEVLGRDYHLNKTNACKEKGIRLIHIFEDEWTTKQDLVKAKLAHILGKSKEKAIGARKTTLVELTSLETEPFLDQNHIQGYIPSAVRLGLKYQEELIAVATFSKSRFDKENSWEVIRYATSKPVQGGFSKLLKHFLSLKPEVKRLVSYADLRWSTGEVYRKFGFELELISTPGYYWGKGTVRHNRQKFMKHKLSKILPIFDPAKTEEENCQENGYWKVYDCGQQKWVLSL